MDDWLVSVVKDGKVVDLYFSHDLSDTRAIKALHPGCSLEAGRVKEEEKPLPVFVPEGKGKKKRTSSRERKSWACFVRCVETEATWPTVVECSKATGIPTWAIYKSIHKDYVANGFRFELIPPEEQKTNEDTDE